jgi:gamma-glutamyltranspeptidase / glutathione hydrolase / leukotriene-C4 hydrolase
MTRPKLARTLRIIADEGVDAFYNGTLTDQIVDEIQIRGGIITKQDLADYQVDLREAVQIDLNGSLTAFTTHAPSSGPILAFIFNLMQGKQDRRVVASSMLNYASSFLLLFKQVTILKKMI